MVFFKWPPTTSRLNCCGIEIHSEVSEKLGLFEWQQGINEGEKIRGHHHYTLVRSAYQIYTVQNHLEFAEWDGRIPVSRQWKIWANWTLIADSVCSKTEASVSGSESKSVGHQDHLGKWSVGLSIEVIRGPIHTISPCCVCGRGWIERTSQWHCRCFSPHSTNPPTVYRPHF